jgi:hypothetical protein
MDPADRHRRIKPAPLMKAWHHASPKRECCGVDRTLERQLLHAITCSGNAAVHYTVAYSTATTAGDDCCCCCKYDRRLAPDTTNL